MCLAHEGTPRGYVTDDIGPLTDRFLANRLHLTMSQLSSAMADLIANERVDRTPDGTYFVRKMVDDMNISIVRSVAGRHGGNPKLGRQGSVVEEIPKKKVFEGTCPGFDGWWALWSKTRGTNHLQQALQAWMSVVTEANVKELSACTQSYLFSLNDPSVGYHPENFLFEQAKQGFTARWPANRQALDQLRRLADSQVYQPTQNWSVAADDMCDRCLAGGILCRATGKPWPQCGCSECDGGDARVTMSCPDCNGTGDKKQKKSGGWNQ